MSIHYKIRRLKDKLPEYIRRGDVVSVKELIYCQQELFMYDGIKLIPFDEGMYIPEGFYVLDEFPLDYWKNAICHNNYVRIRVDTLRYKHNDLLRIRSHHYILNASENYEGYVSISQCLEVLLGTTNESVLIETDGENLIWDCIIDAYMESIGYESVDIGGRNGVSYITFNNGKQTLEFHEYKQHTYTLINVTSTM